MDGEEESGKALSQESSGIGKVECRESKSWNKGDLIESAAPQPL